MRPIKVLHVLGRLEVGGTELRLVETVERVPSDQFRMDFCVLSGEGGSLDARIVRRGGAVIKMPLTRRFVTQFPRLLRAGGYDIVHSHVFYASGFVLTLAAAAGVRRRIAHFRGMADGRRSTIRRRLQRRVLRRLLHVSATDIVACAEGVMDAVWEPRWREDPRCRVIYNGIDPERFRAAADRGAVRDEMGVPRDALMLLHVGYDAAEKNHPRLLRIFSAIGQRVPSARLVLAGAGTDRPGSVVGEHVRALGLQDRVIALGVRQDVPRLLSAADGFLLPSLAEGLPGVVLEACAAGVPVVATDLPGVREIAARLEGVRYLSLDQADTDWATVALTSSAEADRSHLRERAPGLFRSSVFDIDRAVDAHRILWRGMCVAPDTQGT